MQYFKFELMGLILFLLGIVFLIVCASSMGDSNSFPTTSFAMTSLDISIVFSLSGFGMLMVSIIEQLK